MILYGTSHCVGDGVTAAQIIDPAYHQAGDPAVLAAHCLAAVDPTLAERVRLDDMLIAGSDFGVGAEPELAVLALQALGIAAVICVSAAPEFAETAHRYGLPVLVCPSAAATLAPGTLVRIDLASGRIENRETRTIYQAPACPPELIAAVRRSQLLTRMRQVVEEEGYDG